MTVAISIRSIAIAGRRWNVDVPVPVRHCIRWCCAYCCPQGAVLARDSSDESSVAIRVDEFHWLSAAKRCSHFWWSHFAKKEQELSVAEWLASQRMLSSGFDDMRDVPVGQTHCVRLVGDHGRKERINSGHTLKTTNRLIGKTRETRY